MKVTVKEENTKLEVSIGETIDSYSAHELEMILKEKLHDKDTVIFDLRDLSYTTSAGLRVLMATHKLMMKSGIMIVRNVNKNVREIFDITGFSSIFNIE